MTVLPDGEPIFCEASTEIKIDAVNGAEFVVIKQTVENEMHIIISPDNWPAIRKAIDKMIKECRL